MPSINGKHILKPVFANEGVRAAQHLNTMDQLRRSVLSCMLWESEFYEDGISIADRIADLASKVAVEDLAALAIEARSAFNLRHVPLLLLSVLAQRASGSSLVSETIAAMIQCADELTEFLAVYAKFNGVAPNELKPKISAQVKKGLAQAFTRFDAYQLAQHSRDADVRLRDALFLCHAKPKDAEQADLWKRLIADALPEPEICERALSVGSDEKATFERLLSEGRLGYLALLRNLRRMARAGCDENLVRQAVLARQGAQHVLPFRYIAAARAVPQWEPFIDEALCAAIAELPVLTGKTVFLVDVSDSMNEALFAKCYIQRMNAAAGLASILTGDVRILTFSQTIVEVAPRRGMEGFRAVIRSQRIA